LAGANQEFQIGGRVKDVIWTKITNSYLGGNAFMPYDYVFIEADENAACRIFVTKFVVDHRNEVCDCLFDNIHVDSGPSIKRLTAYDRGCAYDENKGEYLESQRLGAESYSPYISVGDLLFRDKDKILIIRKHEFPEGWKEMNIYKQRMTWEED
jgi:hypothetical protein